MTDSIERGPFLAAFSPQGVGVRTGFAPVNASWPFPRQLDIYENGLSVRALGTTVWIPRAAIQTIHRGRANIQVKWELGGGIQSATISSWWHMRQIAEVLQAAGYALSE